MFEGLVTFSKVERIDRGYVTHYSIKLTLRDQDYSSASYSAWTTKIIQYLGLPLIEHLNEIDLTPSRLLTAFFFVIELINTWTPTAPLYSQ